MSNEDNILLEEILKETEGQQKGKVSPATEQKTDAVTELLMESDAATENTAVTEPVAESVGVGASVQAQAPSAELAETPEATTAAESDSESTEAAVSEESDVKSEQAEPAVAELTEQTALSETGQSDKNLAVGAVPQKKKKIKRKKFSYVDVLRGLLPWKGDKVTEVIRKIIFLIAVVVFSVCLYLAGSYYYGLYKSKQSYDDIADAIGEVTVPVTTDVTGDAPAVGSIEEYLQLSEIGKKLLAQNPETVGYISIPGTKVNYPVMQRKNSEDGNSYYLYRNFDLTDSKTGSIFLDYRCTFDDVGEDGYRTWQNSTNLVVYGHNMNDTSMFGSLKNYKNNYSYYSENPIIVLNSNYKTYTYKIFAVFIVDAEDETETKYDYWNYLNFNTEEDFYDYVNKAKRRALQLNGVDVQYGDQLLTLSTCNGLFDTARLVVMARMVRSGEDPYEGTDICEQNPNVLWPTIYYRWNRNTYDPDAAFIPYGPNTEVGTETTGTDSSDTEDTDAATGAESSTQE